MPITRAPVTFPGLHAQQVRNRSPCSPVRAFIQVYQQQLIIVVINRYQLQQSGKPSSDLESIAKAFESIFGAGRAALAMIPFRHVLKDLTGGFHRGERKFVLNIGPDVGKFLLAFEDFVKSGLQNAEDGLASALLQYLESSLFSLDGCSLVVDLDRGIVSTIVFRVDGISN